MGIRIADIKDLETILLLDKEFALEYKSFEEIQDNSWTDKYGYEYYKNVIENDYNAEIILYEQDGKIVGYIEAEYNIIEKEYGDEVFAKMYEFYVISGYRSQGIGRKLFTFFQKSAVDKKCTIIRVSTSFTNLEGQKFYKNIGFHESEIVFDKKIN